MSATGCYSPMRTTLLYGSHCLPLSCFLKKKSVMRFLSCYLSCTKRQNSNSSALYISCWGEGQEGPSKLGPFIIMNNVNHEQSIGDFLETPGRLPAERPVLNPDLDLGTLENLYRQLANIVLSLSTLSLSRIGSIDYENGAWGVLLGLYPIL